MEKYSKYLPSKKFTIISSSCAVLAVIIFVIFFMSSGGESFTISGERKNTALKIENQTITDLIQNDTDQDGIADWEEALWGTDKNKKMTFSDISDSTYINNKKKELKIEQSVNEKKLTETEKFAREFFTSYSAMKSSGQVDDETINSFSNALGQKIVNPELIDRYTESDITISDREDPVKKMKYYENVKNLFKSNKSTGMGDELDIINKGLVSNPSGNSTTISDQYEKLPAIASSYQNFAKKIMEITVPKSLSDYHLRIANNSNNIGISVLSMAKIISDPIIGLSGLSQYQKYSEDLVKAVAELETALFE